MINVDFGKNEEKNSAFSANMPSTAKCYLFRGTFTINGMKEPDLTYRFSSITHTSKNSFKLVFIEMEDFKATKIFDNAVKNNYTFDLHIDYYDDKLTNVMYSNDYKNCSIVYKHEFNLSVSIKAGLELIVECTY
ncbi:MAG: hypothetical protein J6T10_11820 [Methanobrevibacter sp.]|nr:hypothetical protein [Methanobrevibacter sp.]